MKNYLCFLILQVYCCAILAQSDTQKWLTIANPQKSADALVESRKTAWGLGENDALVRPNKVPKTDKFGLKHYRFQQTYENVPIEGAEWLVHEKNGIAKTANGILVRGLNLSTVPTLSEEQALQYALNVVNAEIWAWEDEFLETMLRLDTQNDEATYYPTGELMIFSPDLIKGYATTESYRLVYKFDVYATQPLAQEEIYIDAHNGEVVTSFSLFCHNDVAATGNAAYSCDNPVNIMISPLDTDNGNNPPYRLFDTTRGNGIHTRSADGTDSTPSNTEILSNDAICDEDPVATAVHYGMIKFYDYLLYVHGRNSIDGDGYMLKSWVHFGQNENNAFWGGGRAIFGDGDNIKYAPLTSIDIVGHEFAHGLIGWTAKLKASYEPGALNEGFSDIFGTLVEFYAEPACADWLIGEDVVVQSGKTASRNMSNPKDATMLTQAPNTYKGEYWHFGWQDHGGVHTNSGVLNYWFYLIVNGGSGTNDNDFPYSVAALDNNANVARSKAADIAFLSLTEYLNKFAQYADARAATIDAAIAIYGENSSEVQTVVSAWCAVGVGECEINTNTITLVTPNGGEVWQSGTSKVINWISTGDITQVNIALSINGGASWQTLATATNNDGSYTLEVPNVASTQVLIRIADSNNAITNDVSNAVFTIEGCDVVSSFESSATEVCENESISFTNNTINAATFEWRINGSLESSNTNFNYTFTQAGTYIVSLRSINGNCIDEYTEIITVYAAANASFTYAKTDMTINCHAESADAVASYTWKIDNTVISSEMQLEYAFITAGTYNVCLSVANECGNDEECNLITVNEAVNCGSGEESWREYLNGSHVRDLLEVGDYIYAATTLSGLVKINQINNEIIYFNTGNSDLPNNDVHCLLKSNSNDFFVGTNGGLAKFNGVNSTGWTIFNTANSNLPNNNVNTILQSSSGDIFIGTYGGGLAKFNGTSSTGWTIFNTSNSDLPSNHIIHLLKNSNDDILIATYGGGLAKFNSTSSTGWTIFNTSNSDLPSDYIYSLLECINGDFFVGTGTGLAKFDGTSNIGWTIFNVSNSDLPDNYIPILLESSNGEVFVGTWDGLAKFDGVNNTNWIIFNASNLTDNRITSLLENNHNEIFIGTLSGLSVLTPASSNPLTSSFTILPTPFCTNTQKTFTNTSQNATTYEWRINGNLTSTENDFTHTFTQAGEYTITLKAFDSEGCEDTYSQNITVYNEASNLDLGTNLSECDASSLEISANLTDMQSYEWQFNNTTVGTTASLTATESGTYTLLVTDMCGNSYSDSIDILVGSECVWSGDFNYDQIVNNQDILYLGLGFGESGFERPNASFNWEGQACQDWDIWQENNVNYKHLDADGSGTIDANDAQAIDINYGKTHNSYTSTFNDNESHITLDAEVISGNTFEPDATSTTIVIGLFVNEEDAQQIATYGFAFDVEYYLPPIFGTITNITVVYDESFVGSTSELLTIYKHIAAQNKIEIGLSRYDRSNVIGAGKIADVIVEVDIEVIGTETLSLDVDVSNVKLSLSDNTFLPVGSSQNTFTFTSETPNDTCGTPTNLHESGLTCSSITLNWDAVPNAEAYILAGRKAGGQVKVFPETQATFRTFTSGLQTNTTYQWSVKTKCNGIWTDYAPLQSFTTPSCKNSSYDETKDPFFVSEHEHLFSEINLYPNPAKNDLHISFTSFEEENISIKVFDILGKTVLTKDIEVLQGENRFDLNIASLQSGSYFLQIGENVEKFIVF